MSKLHERLAAYPAHALGDIRRGIEKEGLRVLPTGGLALNNLSGSGDQLALRLLIAQDVRSAVADDHLKPLVVLGQMEHAARDTDHLRVQFDTGQLRARQAAMHPFRDRAAAESDHCDVCGLRPKKQEPHHAARIRLRYG